MFTKDQFSEIMVSSDQDCIRLIGFRKYSIVRDAGFLFSHVPDDMAFLPEAGDDLPFYSFICNEIHTVLSDVG